jgi:putative peptide zinc metalloprotease protein
MLSSAPREAASVVLDVQERPALPPNVCLVGEIQGTGFTDPQWLIQRDSQFIQLSEVLYRVVEQADGRHTLDEIAAGVTQTTNWMMNADDVRLLIQTKLMPLGLVGGADGSVMSPSDHRSRSLLKSTCVGRSWARASLT